MIKIDGCFFYSLVNTSALSKSLNLDIIEARRESIKQWNALNTDQRLPYEQMA
jgi:hypothetical protein